MLSSPRTLAAKRYEALFRSGPKYYLCPSRNNSPLIPDIMVMLTNGVFMFRRDEASMLFMSDHFRHRPALPMGQLALLLTTLICVLILFVEGCSPIALSVEHNIDIPLAYSSAEPTEAGVAPLERYRDAYERGWWSCIAEKIRVLDEPCRNISASRWHSEVFGYADGSTAADGRVKQLVESYGKDRTLSYLRDEYNRRAARGEGKKKP